MFDMTRHISYRLYQCKGKHHPLNYLKGRCYGLRFEKGDLRSAGR